MVIMITGATHTGKTKLAEKLVKKTGWFCLSIDHLKMGLIRSGNTSLTPYDDKELTAYLWPIVREMIKTAIENRQDLIVEGCYVPFRWKDDLEDRYPEQIRYICLAMTERYISSHLDDIISHACDAEERLDDTGITPEELIRDNLSYIDGCRKAGNELLLINNDWSSSVEAWLDRFDI